MHLPYYKKQKNCYGTKRFFDNLKQTKSFLEKCSTIFFLNHRNTKKIPVADDNEKTISDDNLVSED